MSGNNLLQVALVLGLLAVCVRPLGWYMARVSAGRAPLLEGLAVLIALVRGFVRASANTIGNFWTDLVRGTLYILLPLSVVLSIVLASQGVAQSLTRRCTLADHLIELQLLHRALAASVPFTAAEFESCATA